MSFVRPSNDNISLSPFGSTDALLCNINDALSGFASFAEIYIFFLISYLQQSEDYSSLLGASLAGVKSKLAALYSAHRNARPAVGPVVLCVCVCVCVWYKMTLDNVVIPLRLPLSSQTVRRCQLDLLRLPHTNDHTAALPRHVNNAH